MLQGLNSNIKHRGKIFHIQTEDSGVKYGHIISHLFHEGSILSSVKTGYKDLIETVSDGELEGEIHKLMRKSHRKMVAKLTAGGFDEKLSANAPNENAATENEPVENKLTEEPEQSDDASSPAITESDEIEPKETTDEVEEAEAPEDAEEINLSDVEIGNNPVEVEENKPRKSTAEILNEEEARELEELKKNFGFEVMAIDNDAVMVEKPVASENDLPSVDEVFKKIQSSIYMVESKSEVKEHLLSLMKHS